MELARSLSPQPKTTVLRLQNSVTMCDVAWDKVKIDDVYNIYIYFWRPLASMAGIYNYIYAEVEDFWS